MAVSPTSLTHTLSQQALLEIFLPAMRQRFKQEVNRLTGGAMAELLGPQPDSADLSFLMSYLYAWHWLGHNVHAAYRAQVLASFRGGKFDFLMKLLLADTAEGFVQGLSGIGRVVVAGRSNAMNCYGCLVHRIKMRSNLHNMY